jgi:hypothetical protein
MILHLLQSSGPGFFEIITKGLSSFQQIFLYLFLLVIVWTAYRFVGYCIHLYFYFKLRNKTLDEFINVLGKDYFFKKLSDGDKRFKWTKWYIQIKANFDDEGSQVSRKVTPFKFWHYAVVLSFQ